MTNYEKLFNDIREEMECIDIVDVHTHLRWDVPQARSLGEIVFYHFITFELCSAGMPAEAARLPDERDRLLQALPFFPLIRTTGTYYCLKSLLQDLYGMKEELLTEENLDEMIAKVKDTAADKEWPREVLARRARIRKSFLNIVGYPDWSERVARGDDEVTRYRDLFVPVIEDACFVASDAPRLVRQTAGRSGKNITDAAGLAEAVNAYVPASQLDAIKAYLGWATVDFLYDQPDAAAADAIIRKVVRGDKTTPEEDNILRIFAFTTFLQVLQARRIPFQFFFGSENTPRGGPSVCVYKDETFRRLSALFTDYPRMRFDLFIGSANFSQEAANQVKMHPNLHVAGIWWHNMYPTFIRRMLAERLDVCPLNKVTAFFSDSYMVEWSYGKRKLVQRELAGLLAERVATGYITRNDAGEIARRWMWTNPVEMYGLEDEPES